MKEKEIEKIKEIQQRDVKDWSDDELDWVFEHLPQEMLEDINSYGSRSFHTGEIVQFNFKYIDNGLTTIDRIHQEFTLFKDYNYALVRHIDNGYKIHNIILIRVDYKQQNQLFDLIEGDYKSGKWRHNQNDVIVLDGGEYIIELLDVEGSTHTFKGYEFTAPHKIEINKILYNMIGFSIDGGDIDEDE